MSTNPFSGDSAASFRQHRVREIDFRRPSKFPRDQIRRLEHAHEGFCRSASSRLSAELRTDLALEVIGSDQLSYATVMAEEVPRQALVAVLRLEPLDTEVLLIMELSLAASLVDRLLGGPGRTAAAPPDGLTEVEVAVARRALETLVGSLSATWLDLAEVSFSITTTSTSPLSIQIVPPSEPTLLLNISAELDGQLSIMTLCLPHRSVEAITDRLEQSHFGPSESDDEASGQVRTAVRDVKVEMRAEVASLELSLGQVLGLRPGDVLNLRRPAARGVVVHASDVPAYTANAGRNGNFRAVQITGRWDGSA